MSTFDAMLSVRLLECRHPYVTAELDSFALVVEKILATSEPRVVAEALDSVIAPLDERIYFLSGEVEYRRNEFVELSDDSKRKISALESQVEQYAGLGESFTDAVRFGWRFTADDGTKTESRCISREVAEAEARRIVDLFTKSDSGTDCECVVVDCSDDDLEGSVVYRITSQSEAGASRD